MRGAAVAATWVALGTCLAVAVANFVVLQWEDSAFGRHTMAGMVLVAALLGLFLTVLTDRTPPYVLVVVVMCALVAMAAWRLILILRRPR